EGAGHGTETGRQQDQRRLSVGQLPTADDEGEHVADQEEVEEIQHIAQVRRGDDLPLVAREGLLLLEQIQHGAHSLCGHSGTVTVIFIAGPWRATPAPKPPVAARPEGWPRRPATRVRRKYLPKPA